jgi:hypothetical protein
MDRVVGYTGDGKVRDTLCNFARCSFEDGNWLSDDEIRMATAKHTQILIWSGLFQELRAIRLRYGFAHKLYT